MGRRQKHTLIMVWVNFALFVILFAALGFLIWQSASLVARLRDDLERAEQAVAEMQVRLQSMNPEEVVGRLVATATDQLDDSVREAVQESEIAETMLAIQAIYESVEGLDPEQLAQSISSDLLLGLSDGLREAAEARDPRSPE